MKENWMKPLMVMKHCVMRHLNLKDMTCEFYISKNKES